MFRLLIADDEDEERMGIRFLLNKFGFPFEVEEAADGAQALAMLEQEPADILLTDVKMPFLDGIGLATQVRRRFPDMQIIFFSGYDDFEYVKQALSLRAVDYILKPVNPAEFQRVIAKVAARLSMDEEESSQNQAFQENYVITRLINQISWDKLCQEYGEERLEFLNAYTRLVILQFDQDVFGNVISDVKAFAELFESVIPCGYDFLDLNPSQGVFLLRGIDRDKDYLRELARCIHLMVEKEYRQSCCLAVSRAIDNPRELGGAFQAAEASLEERFFYPAVSVYPRNGEKTQAAPADDGQLMQLIEKAVDCRDCYSLRQHMAALLELCRNNGLQSYIYTRFVCANLLRILVKELPDGAGRLAGLVEQIYACPSFAGLEDILWKAADELEAAFAPAEESPSQTVRLVEQYIQEHYGEVLSLDILAEKVFLTPHYLSSVFIQEKGIGINRYIKNVRMEKAKEFLRDTNMKIGEICGLVGYANVSYFCRSFRNEYGVTPEQFRR